MSWIQTYTGRKFDLLNPTPDMVSIEDIAHALSLICRFTGHTHEHYSVAQHSVFVSNIVPSCRLQALLHDAAEAYVGDMSSPLKHLLPSYQEIEARVWKAIAQRFGVPQVLDKCVKEADLVALSTERRDLMSFSPERWALPYTPLGKTIRALPSYQARTDFLCAFKQLKGAE